MTFSVKVWSNVNGVGSTNEIIPCHAQ